MKKIIIHIFLLLMITSCMSDVKTNISVMTYNVRYGLADDGENSWEYRKKELSNLIKSKEPDFLGTQEGLPFQISYINNAMPNYEFIGTDRDGNGKGENTAIFYNTSKYKVLKQHTFWLSPTQNKVSKGWDAAYPRICTYGLFTNKLTKQNFWVINTHFDHIGVEARKESALLILNKIEEINTKNYPLIFMGDLNAEPESKPVISLKTHLVDSKEVSIEKPKGPDGTFNAFQFGIPVTKRIDYIFISNNNTIQVNNYTVLNDSKESKYPSDHLPVFVELTIKKN